MKIVTLFATLFVAGCSTFSAGACYPAEPKMPEVCYTSAVVDKEATICEGATSYYENAGTEGLAEEVKSLTETLETTGCRNTCSLSDKESVAFGKHSNGKAFASVVFTGVR